MKEHTDVTPRRTLAALVFVLALVLAACGSGAPASGGEAAATDGEAVSIVATTSILGDVTGQVAGDTAEVAVLMPPGADPHNFEASAQQLVQLLEADLIVANGGNLEEQLTAALEEAEAGGVPVFHAVDHIETLTFDGAHGHDDDHATEDDHADQATEDDDHGHATEDDDDHDDEGDHGHADDHAHEEGAVDPHFWTNPTRTADVAVALGEQVGQITGEGETVDGQADAYVGRLAQTDRDVEQILSGIPDDARTLVTNHEAFGYFAERYGFTIVGTVIPSLTTGAEPSAQDLEQLARTVEQQQVRAVFAENTAPGQLAEALAQEAGADVQVVQLYSDSLGEQGSGAETYVDMLTTNAQLISDALGT